MTTTNLSLRTLVTGYIRQHRMSVHETHSPLIQSLSFCHIYRLSILYNNDPLFLTPLSFLAPRISHSSASPILE